MNLKEVNKWLDDEFGCSYTKLEELHDFYFEKYTDLHQENQRLKEMKYKTLIDLQDRIDRALKLIKENVKDEYGIIDVATVWEVERVLEGDKDVKD